VYVFCQCSSVDSGCVLLTFTRKQTGMEHFTEAVEEEVVFF